VLEAYYPCNATNDALSEIDAAEPRNQGSVIRVCRQTGDVCEGNEAAATTPPCQYQSKLIETILL
jgi:hypothetical protein